MSRLKNGFTLIEMLVALAIFSLAALALARLDAFAIRTAGDLAEIGGARLVAQNEAALALSDPGAPTIGVSQRDEVNGGIAFTVTRTVTPTPDPTLMRIDIDAQASVPDGGRASLTVIRAVEP